MKAHPLFSFTYRLLYQVLASCCFLISYSEKLAWSTPSQVTTDSCTRGDLNQNGISYEIADFILIENYFLYGDSIFSSDPAIKNAQICNSDVNKDGLPLRIADLVYMGRVIWGYNPPLPLSPSLSQKVSSVDFQIVQEADRLVVSYNSPVDLGGVFLELHFLGTAGDPARLDSNPNLDYGGSVKTGQLQYFLASSFFSSPPGTGKIPAGRGPLLSIPFSGNLRSVEIQVSDTSGQEVSATGSFPLDNRGDLNADGNLTPSDVVQELYCVFQISTTNCSLALADLDCDGMLTAMDVVNILSAAFQAKALPICTP